MVAFSRVIASMAVAVALLIAPALAHAAVLYDQTDHAGTPTADPSAMNFSPSNDLGTGVGADRTADDFPVPAGQTWSINEVDVGGAYVGTPPGTVNVFIYADASGQPGASGVSNAAQDTVFSVGILSVGIVIIIVSAGLAFAALRRR